MEFDVPEGKLEASAKEISPHEMAVVNEIYGLKPLGEMTPVERDSWLFKTRQDPKSPYNDSKNAHHNVFMALFREAYALKYPPKTEEQIQAEQAALHAEGEKSTEAALEKQAEQQLRRVTDELKGEWGSRFEENVTLAKRVVGQFASEEEQQYLAESGLANDSKFIKLLSSLGEMFQNAASKMPMKRAEQAKSRKKTLVD